MTTLKSFLTITPCDYEMGQKKFSLVAIYDTETTNVGEGASTRAFPVLFIVNDISGIDLSDYQIGRDDDLHFFRTEQEMLTFIDERIKFGRQNSYVPVIAAYNLMFDLQPLMNELSNRYAITANAQSSQNVYTLDLCDGNGGVLLRFWDTWFLEMRGLKAMGETCGLPKAIGDWDYSLVRTPETYLTREELHYAARDVQVIPAYLKYLLRANEWMSQGDFGIRILTKTSLVRKMAERNIGNKKVVKKNEKKLTLGYAFIRLCEAQLPATYNQYALRRTSFRGGFTFTSARYASQVVENVASMDVTSMHHAFINGRMVPTDFNIAPKCKLETAYNEITSRSLVWVLDHYDRPFDNAVHAKIRFDNLRLKEGTCFNEWGIATLSYSKFQSKYEIPEETNGFNVRALFAEGALKNGGWHDYALNPEFAYGKLYAADCAIVHLSEIELWVMAQVYDWDSHECIYGELSTHFITPPDYVTLQSNLLYRMKDDVKTILKHYQKGVRYELDVPDTIPEGIARNLRAGALDESFLQSYYQSTVKGMFNSIYGTQAQDIYKPDFGVDADGNLEINRETVTTPENFESKQPNVCKVLYPYGLRIVAGSRMHLVIAMEILWEALGDKVCVTGGDTDSLKVRCDESVGDDDLISALTPLHESVTRAIGKTQARVRETFPDMASDLHDVGCFDIEECGHGSTRYKYHMEAWNKARVSIDAHGKCHVTCAGLRRPANEYNVERFAEDLLAAYPPDEILPCLLGYNTFVDTNLSFALEQHIPKADDRIYQEITDYRGHAVFVDAHQSKALYDTGRWLGSTQMNVNRTSVQFKWRHYAHKIDTLEKILRVDESGNPCIYVNGSLKYTAKRGVNNVRDN